jgi:hypothetical protein
MRPTILNPTALPEHGITVGLVYVQGAGYRVCAEDSSAAAARRFAKQLEGQDAHVSAFLKPVIEALEAAAASLDKTEDFATVGNA